MWRETIRMYVSSLGSTAPNAGDDLEDGDESDG